MAGKIFYPDTGLKEPVREFKSSLREQVEAIFPKRIKSPSELTAEKREENKKNGICPNCDPPGCGKECRGGPCYTCKGSGIYPA